MELDCFLCNEPLQEGAPNDFSDSLRQQHVKTLIRLFIFIHQYSAADVGASRPLPSHDQSLQGLEQRLQGVKHCKKCTGSLRQLVQTFKSYDNLGNKLEGYKSDWVGRLERLRTSSSNHSFAAGTNQTLREETSEVAGAPDDAPRRTTRGGAPFLKLRRLEQIRPRPLGWHIPMDTTTSIQHRETEDTTIKQEPLDVEPELCTSIDPPPPSPAQEFDSEHENQDQEEPSKPFKKKRNRKRYIARSDIKSVKRYARLTHHACDSASGCSSIFETYPQLEEHATTAHASEPRPWTCDQKHSPTFPCTAAFFQEASLLQHIHYVHSTRFKHPCPQCLQGFDVYLPFQRHQKRDHHQVVGVRGKPITQKKKPEDRRPGVRRNLLPYFPCDLVDEGCEFRGPDEWTTQRHVAQEHPKTERPHACHDCGARFATEHRLARHTHWLHSGARYPCQDCDFGCQLAKVLALHHRRVHGKGFRCPQSGCEFVATLHCNLRDHLESSIHAKVARHMCQHCGQTFMKNEGLGRHINSSHPELVDPEELAKHKHPCGHPNCGRIFRSAPQLRDHVKAVHEQEFRFHCEKCGKGFLYEYNLRAHSRSHLEPHEFEHECTVCGAKFRRNRVLTAHMRRHTGKFEEQHACRHCGKNFIDTKGRSRHEKLHEGVLKHVCPVCGRRFPLRGYLAQHMRSHETEEQKEARKKDGKELPQVFKMYVDRKKEKKGAAPYPPLYYAERGPRINFSRVVAPPEEGEQLPGPKKEPPTIPGM